MHLKEAHLWHNCVFMTFTHQMNSLSSFQMKRNNSSKIIPKKQWILNNDVGRNQSIYILPINKDRCRKRGHWWWNCILCLFEWGFDKINSHYKCLSQFIKKTFWFPCDVATASLLRKADALKKGPINDKNARYCLKLLKLIKCFAKLYNPVPAFAKFLCARWSHI